MNHNERPSYRQAVAEIQTYLYHIAQIDPDIPRVNPDGIYGETTVAAVTAFQKKYPGRREGIPDGRVDYPTFQQLLTEYRKARTALGSPVLISPFGEHLKNGRLIRGDRSSLVMLVRLMLNTIGQTYREAEALPISDHFDSALAAVIRDFQITQGLPPDGEIDRETWDRLAMAYNQTVKSYDS